MKKAKTSYYLRKALMSFMTIAFFYLVIGDLIIIHQKKIFNYDVYAGQAILKPSKSGKDDHIDLKGLSSSRINQLITFMSACFDFNQEYVDNSFAEYLPVIKPFQGLGETKLPSFSLRGPPMSFC